MENQALIRAAQPEDVLTIIGLIHEMAHFEKLEDQLVLTPELLEHYLFDQKKAEALLLEVQGSVVGYALFFESFSTFEGRTGLYLEDIFISKDQRSQGMGKALFKAVASEAVRRGCPRMEWACLDWNQHAIEFYLSLQAQPLEQWTVYRLTGDALKQAGSQ